jgi:hypothetical protein
VGVATAALFTGGFQDAPARTIQHWVGVINGKATGSADGTIAAVEYEDGVWTNHGTILAPSSPGDYTSPWLLHDGTQYVIYLAHYDVGTDTWVTLRFTCATLTGTWSSGTDIGVDDARFPTVLLEGSTWRMWAGDAVNNDDIRYLTSSDGISWSDHGVVMSLGTGWEADFIQSGAIMRHGDTYYLYFIGKSGFRWQGGLATFTDPLGTYTRDASNPVLAREGLSYALTANNSSSAIVTVASTTGLVVGQSVVLVDTNSPIHSSHIASVDSGTQVTLEEATTTLYATAQGATLRPQTYNSVQPRVIWGRHDGWEMWFTAFQPVDDLTIGGETIREGVMRATAPDPEGPWTIQQAEGLAFHHGSGVYAISAENISRVAVG